MSPGERSRLLRSIATTTADYERARMTPQHIERWVSQFERNAQGTILVELDAILKKHYLSKKKAIEIIDKAIGYQPMVGQQPCLAISQTRFLRGDGQRSRSQNELLALVGQAVLARHGLSISTCGTSPSSYFYLDDCVFTGRTNLEDVRRLLLTMVPGTTLWVFFLAAYVRGFSRFTNELRPAAARFGVQLEARWAHLYQDNFSEGKCEVLWPAKFTGYQHVDAYVQQRKAACPTASLFRAANALTQETLFSSPEARSIVEQAFLERGAYIVSQPTNPSPLMRPLGYTSYGWPESLGFGSMFVTYRNCPNNCPLVLWWGDSSLPSSHPLGRWYPLFPRNIRSS